MDDDSQPKVLANRIILQFVQHSVSPDAVVTPQDYIALRVVFRKCGGSWEKVMNGEQVDTELLKTIIMAWGMLPGREKGLI